MSLENIKFKKLFENSEDILRIFLAFVFLAAGIFRIFIPDMAVFEFNALNLPIFLSGVTVFFEIGVGLCLLFNRYLKFVYWLLVIFLIFILTWALIISGKSLFFLAGELFIFNLTPTDWFLHFVFLLITVTLLIKKIKYA